jgi:hypothetical protein
MKFHDTAGPGAALFNIALENIAPKNAKLEETVDSVAIAQYEATAAAEKVRVGVEAEANAIAIREGAVTEFIAKRAKDLGVDPGVIVAQDTLKNTQAVIVAGGDNGMLGALERLGRGKPQNKPQSTT